MLESTSWDMPTPTGISARLDLVPPVSSSSQVEGPFGRPPPPTGSSGSPRGRASRCGRRRSTSSWSGCSWTACRSRTAPVLALRLLGDVAEVQHAGLQRRGRHDPLDQVVTRTGVDLRCRPGRELGIVDVIDGDGDAVVLAPLLGEAVEPRVVRGDEMAPLEDLQLLRATCACRGIKIVGAPPSCRADPCHLDELAPSEASRFAIFPFPFPGERCAHRRIVRLDP